MDMNDLKRAVESEESIDRQMQQLPITYEDFSIQLDASMLAELVSRMEKSKETHITMHTLVRRLLTLYRVSLGAKTTVNPVTAPTQFFAATTAHFASPSVVPLSPALSSPASSISSTMPSPLFEISPIGGTTPVDPSFSNFKFKTPKKIIFPVDVIDLTKDPSDNKMNDGPGIFGLPGDSQFAGPFQESNAPKFQIGKGNAKGPASKKKGKLTTAAGPTNNPPPPPEPPRNESVKVSFAVPSSEPTANKNIFANESEKKDVSSLTSKPDSVQKNGKAVAGIGIGIGPVTSSGRPVAFSHGEKSGSLKRNAFYPTNYVTGDLMDISSSFPSPTPTPDERTSKINDQKSISLGDIYLGQFKNMNIGDNISPPPPLLDTVNLGPASFFGASGEGSSLQSSGNSAAAHVPPAATGSSANSNASSVPTSSIFDPGGIHSSTFNVPPTTSFSLPVPPLPLKRDQSMDSVLKPFVGLKLSEVAGSRTNNTNASGIENTLNPGGLFSGVGSSINPDASLLKAQANNISFSLGADDKKSTGYAKKKNVRSKEIAKNASSHSVPAG